jgi:hypothetical protein
MQLVPASDFCDVQEAFINGISSVDEIAPGVVRVSFYAERKDPNDGDTERKIVDFQLWTLQQLKENTLLLHSVLANLQDHPLAPRITRVEAMN